MGKNIVLVEDDLAVNEGLVMTLERSGFVVHSFFNVTEFEQAALPGIDLFIIDRQLNGTNGLELCRRIKANPATSHLPVLIISASPGTEQYAMAAGGDAYLEKPFSKKQLLILVENLVRS